jgi:hypothetical protein
VLSSRAPFGGFIGAGARARIPRGRAISAKGMIVERSVGAAAIKEAVRAAGVAIKADNLT